MYLIYLTSVMLSSTLSAGDFSLDSRNLSHYSNEDSLSHIVEKIKDKIQNRKDLPYITVAEQLKIVDELQTFAFGQFLLEKGGLNGYWTHYVVTHPSLGRITGHNEHDVPFSPLEEFLLDKAPTCLATQQRYAIFKREIQKRVKEDVHFASVPCGLMGELLEIDYSEISHFTLTGIDLDPASTTLALSYAQKKELQSHCQFFMHDAWELAYEETFDLIASNGLTIYEKDDEKVIDLYRTFYAALKPKGCLLISFLTPPPLPGKPTEWLMDKVNKPDALKQKILFSDILDAKWQVYRTSSQVENDLKSVGFDKVEIFYDTAHIFPTIVATKS